MDEALTHKAGPSLRPFEGPTTRSRKRRLSQQAVDAEDAARRQVRCPSLGDWSLCLYIRWTTLCGDSKVTRLPLRLISSIEQLQGLFSRLIRHAYDGSDLPDFLTSPAFLMCTPLEEFVSVPSALGSTHFRLVLLAQDGWEYTVAERDLSSHPDPAADLMVTMAEFQSNALDLGDHEVVFNMVSYPTVCVQREVVERMIARCAEGPSA
ncbi:hypothetical protein APUTEX25_005205 [Auxenochlorella protothecoides]|uniref:Uncharacterized protein n=1 Tax=Auxenochlorella protothecoides TaxID=3075 RepID=A0A1D1ZY91_AUXPR|nr:hypothetical protein APUTEX25_005205 [Auxenochlorella protothecoides]|eukprot:RMZ53216.1 hypothetical protein APUTEX25_005205 [Auxenochlorella protothecoides]